MTTFLPLWGARPKKVEENIDEINQEITNKINNNSDKIDTKNFVIDTFFKVFFKTMTFCLKTFVIILKCSGIYLLWICLHYFSAHLYIKFCVPESFLGFIMSPFMISTPHCQGLRWIVYSAASVINNMWLLIGAWIYSLIWIINNDNAVKESTL